MGVIKTSVASACLQICSWKHFLTKVAYLTYKQQRILRKHVVVLNDLILMLKAVH